MLPMHYLYRIFIGLIAAAILLTFFSLIVSSGTYLLIHNPKAMDFLAFFTGAKLLSYSPGELYNISAQLVTQQNVSPLSRTIFIAFVNPPFVAMLFIPLVKLGLENAYSVWTACNFCILVIFCYVSYRQLKTLTWYFLIIIFLFIFTFIPVLTTLLIGQLSLLLTLIFLLTWIFLKKGWEFRGGLMLSLLLIKPQFFVLPFIAMLLQKKIKLSLGLITGILILTAISYFLVGTNGLINFLQTLNASYHGDLRYDPDLMAQHSLQTAFLILFQTKKLATISLPWIISITVISIPTLFIWTKRYETTTSQFSFQFALLIIATLLISPHTHFHDLSMLLAANISLLSVINKLRHKQKKKLIIFLITGYLLVFMGFVLDVWTQNASRPLWIIADVLYLVTFWYILLKTDIKNTNR
jgi:hypothetical protein